MFQNMGIHILSPLTRLFSKDLEIFAWTWRYLTSLSSLELLYYPHPQGHQFLSSSALQFPYPLKIYIEYQVSHKAKGPFWRKTE